MSIGFIILEKDETMSHEISAKLGKIWVFAEIILFCMVGTQVNLPVALRAGGVGIAIVALGLVARSIGTFVSLIRSGLTIKEKAFVILAYLPKATVQAAIGAAPLAAMQAAGMSTVPGDIILAIAVISILVTAPLGAIAIKISGERFLSTDLPAETSMSRERPPSALAEEPSPMS
jgi:NhaP-type Na+/H+ or K+/H+ antiporter